MEKTLKSIVVSMMLVTIIGACISASADPPLEPVNPDRPIIEGDITEVETTGIYEVTVKTSHHILNEVEYFLYVDDVCRDRRLCDNLDVGVTFSVSLTEGEHCEIKAKAESELGLESGWSPILELGEEEEAISYPILSSILAQILEGRPFLSFLFEMFNL